jgi:hypothetical protein
VPAEVPVPLSDKEMEQVKRIAKRDGVSEDEAASRLFSEGLARRVKRRTGKNPAKVYQLKRAA